MNTSLITEIASLGALVVQEAPVFIEFIEKVYSIIAEKRTPTADEWSDIISLVKDAGAEDDQIKAALNSKTN
ncbi:hypothetical protein HKD21_11500 [Gluconobacter cerevisiae]|uniref:Uncharacterized protein n=3 Tax=Gluconobacter TaxID=441 RepID=A0A149TN19_9PROT|nr:MULTISPECIES: hypothetical protein [Gluconobacter]KXV50773.1 hypothetical protein AD945_01340 [Gluconobacter albidus]MBF0877468.1 hypothetical protein [Gluconobacter cerevisiae]GBR32384.1 hypothetical protein AA3266_1062 [Gluconobacter kondonii NBRC 3266]GLQ65229.1 hypothetical protein GCM10007870_08130 [Gluconobacter kondonii]